MLTPPVTPVNGYYPASSFPPSNIPESYYNPPTGINQDGSVMIGASANGPWIWDGAGGMRSLATFFTSAGIDYSGWTLNSVSAISADGKVLAGAGLSPTGKYRAWIARLF